MTSCTPAARRSSPRGSGCSSKSRGPKGKGAAGGRRHSPWQEVALVVSGFNGGAEESGATERATPKSEVHILMFCKCTCKKLII